MSMVRPIKAAVSRTSQETEAMRADLAMLQSMSHGDLKERWQKVYGAPAPKNLSRRLMIYALAYEVQVKVYGGLSRAAKQQLHDIAPSLARAKTGTRV